jgi:hypothetical protein
MNNPVLLNLQFKLLHKLMSCVRLYNETFLQIRIKFKNIKIK